MSVDCTARGSDCSLEWAEDGRIMRCDINSSCQSAATCETVKALPDMHVSSARLPRPYYLYVHVIWTGGVSGTVPYYDREKLRGPPFRLPKPHAHRGLVSSKNVCASKISK